MLFQEGLAAGLVKTYLSTVQHAQIAQGLSDPKLNELPQLEHFLKGMKRLSLRQSVANHPGYTALFAIGVGKDHETC